MKAAFAGMRRVIGVTALVVGIAGSGAGCSLLVEREKAQCVTDKDCQRFDAGSLPLCQKGICVASGLGPPGCFKGVPSSDGELLNQCTSGQCLPFDNCARLGLCGSGELPALKDQPQVDGGL